MILECANGASCPIAAMHVWRDALESGVPFEGDCFFIGSAALLSRIWRSMESPRATKCVIMVLYVEMRWRLLLDLKACWRMRLSSAIGVEGNHDVLVARVCSDGEAASFLVKSLHSGFVMTNTWLEGASTGGDRTARGVGKVGLALVDWTFWHCWARWPMILSLASGQYLAALE